MIDKNFKGFSGWLALGALAVTLAGPVSRSAYASSQEDKASDQKAAQAADKDVALVALAATPVPPASASVGPVYAPPAMSPSSYNWTGFYVGAHVGKEWGAADVFINPLPTAVQFVNLLPQTIHTDPSGALGGAQVGYNFQYHHFVLGAEFDISASGMTGSKVVSPIVQNNGTPFPGTGFISAHQDTSWVAMIRPRLGVTVFPRMLVYGTGGVAFAHVTEFATVDFRPVGTTQYPAFFDDTRNGWVGGVGGELGLTRRWSVRGEYLYYNLGTDSKIVNAIPLLPPFQVGYTIGDTTANVVNFGVNFRF